MDGTHVIVTVDGFPTCCAGRHCGGMKIILPPQERRHGSRVLQVQHSKADSQMPAEKSLYDVLPNRLEDIGFSANQTLKAQSKMA
ncbi:MULTISPECIES: hypothetical protein [Agrobacterium tumefaciens complex]|uniref:Uncharacterized protein n=2 Tax=Agrobacterium tumefaciens complex TaxID=1183400 RepID=A0AAW8LWW4_AGRTU|nr:hypothetical protein [Agrobacterium tumefaciens]MBB4408103.1 hypothetical protein [Agrobacterium radiobacter]MDP9873913.1 hypothetical protein [Agrobacterium tumefaciens]MDR6703537.1 hypothetical protein [Agrobacterium tumefaciens]